MTPRIYRVEVTVMWEGVTEVRGTSKAEVRERMAKEAKSRLKDWPDTLSLPSGEVVIAGPEAVFVKVGLA